MRHIEPDEKPSERQPSRSCERRDCKENLFGYCQTMPSMDKEGKCQTYKRSIK